MPNEIKQILYKNDFEKFLAHTDEKSVLLKEIVKNINIREYTSLLDIGAGNGLLSIPLSKHVDTYLAVEPKDSFVEKLQAAGLETIHGNFPIAVPDMYDLVLASHSISYDQKEFEPFVKAAWEAVAPNGELLIITYRGQEDDWTMFMQQLGSNPIDSNRIGYNALISLLNTLGEVKYRKVQTKVVTNSLEHMVEALAFVASDGISEKKQMFLLQRLQIEKILLSQYATNDGFEFPFWHYFISTHKSS